MEDLKNATFDRMTLEKEGLPQAQIAQAKKNFEGVKNWLLTHSKASIQTLTNNTAGKLCNVVSYYLYGVGSGQENRGFSQFYTDEVRKGNISMGSSGPYIGSGFKSWESRYHLKQSTNISQARQDLEKSGADIAITGQDTNGSERANHFFLIARDGDQWRNMDHTHRVDNLRGGPVRWGKVHKLIYQGINR